MYKTLETLTLLAVILNILQHWVNGNLTLDFKVTKISGTYKPAVNCLVGNTTYGHGEIFKLDCKTQCVCENGRHACSSLCPKEQLPAPEDTMSCRSPRLVEVPGHCCKMWLCENPTADVYATCHNSSSSPWSPCSNACGLGISTRFTSTAYGCNQLSNLRLCENRKCPETTSDDVLYTTQSVNNNNNNHNINMKSKNFHHKPKMLEHRIRKGHDCRNVQHLSSARIRLGECVSRKLYRPRLCGRCHDERKCCVPSVSTTIQVELLCPLNAIDPISYVEQQFKQNQDVHHNAYHHEHHHHPQYHHQYHFRTVQLQKISIKSLPPLWDVQNLEPIDQETLQSHQIQIENKFVAVEWILKCECHENEYCRKNFTNISNIKRNSHIVDNLKEKKHINNYNNNNNYSNKKNYQQHFDDSTGNADSIKFLSAVYTDHYETNDNDNEEVNRKIKFNKKLNHRNQHWDELRVDSNSNSSISISDSSNSDSNSWENHSKSTILNDVQSDIIPNPVLLKRHTPPKLHRSKRKKSTFSNDENININGDSERIISSRRKTYQLVYKNTH